MFHGCQLAKLTVIAVETVGEEGCHPALLEAQIAGAIVQDLMTNVRVIITSMIGAGFLALDPESGKVIPGPAFGEMKKTVDEAKKEREEVETALAIEQLLKEVSSSFGRGEDRQAEA